MGNIVSNLSETIFKRPNAHPENYPFENTVLMIKYMDTFMDYVLELKDSMEKLVGKKTFSLAVLGLPTYVVTNDLANITYILKTNFDNFPKGYHLKMRFQDLLGNGIFNAE